MTNIVALACVGLVGCDSGGDLKEGIPPNTDMTKNHMPPQAAAAGPFNSNMMKAGASAGAEAAKKKGAAMPGMPGAGTGAAPPIPK